ncbi:DNA primase [Patescibacteria group bacterium]|nr:DNA primase [Patescibacteria group bacterium]
MADTVQQIKDKLSIVDVVGPYVKLTKAGRYYRGLSPFNKEKTPSFYVNTERNSYYCFSSGQGGDAFTFIQKMEGVDFKGALKILAEKAGVPLVYERTGNKDDKEKQERLRTALSEAEAFYARGLDEKGAAYAYAISRGLTPETIRSWNLGLAPDAWRALLEELSGKGYSVPELEAAGLIKEADEKKGTWYDRFRNRLMFPIRDSAGRTVAFTGRALDKEEQAKYLNSPETELFKKSQILFGMDRAKDAIRTRGFALLVEGQFDVILAHQAGFANTIALSGTALSSSHLQFIKRYSDNLMLALDSDRAGLAASARTAALGLSLGMKVKAVRMPKGKDPADMIAENPKEFAGLVASSEPIVEFFLSALSAEEKDTHRLVLAAERIVMPLIVAMKSPLEQEHFIEKVARALNMGTNAVRKSLANAAQSVVRGDLEEPKAGPSGEVKMTPLEMRIALIHGAVLSYPGSPLAERLTSEYARITGTDLPEEAPPERVLFEAGLALGETPDEHSADDLIHAFEHAFLSQKLADATSRLRAAETQKDEAAINAATQECRELSLLLSALAR